MGDQTSSRLTLCMFVEEICCELCRFHHVAEDGLQPEQIRVIREAALGTPNAFADIYVQPEGLPAYYVEAKYGYGAGQIISRLRHKYGSSAPPHRDASKLILVVDAQNRTGWTQMIEEVRKALRPGLELEVWDETRLCSLIRDRFNVRIDTISGSDLVGVREAIDRAKWAHAFGDRYRDSPLRSSLLWHFGFWRLRQLHEEGKREPNEIIPPRKYQQIAVILADLSAFSSYVRDTPSDKVVRDSLTAFYSKARYQVINSGGMLYQFVGDEVVGLFGIPDHQSGHVENALQCALSLVDVGSSTSHSWQRQIDRVQAQGGVHIGMAIGDLQLVWQRPFSRSQFGVVGDCINLAARLMGMAGPSEIVVSNIAYQRLGEASQADFDELPTIEARNMGMIKAWKYAPREKPQGSC